MNMINKRTVLLAAIAVGCLVLCLVIGLIPQAAAASSSEIEGQLNELEKENEELNGQIEDLKNQESQNATDVKAMLEQKNLLDQQVGLLYLQVSNLNEQVTSYNQLVADKQVELDSATQELLRLAEENRDRIQAIEENGQISYWAVLLKSESFTEFLDRLAMVQEIAAEDARRLEELTKAAEEVEAARLALLEEKQELQLTQEEMALVCAELEKKSTEAQTMLANLISKGEEYAALLAQLEMEQNTLLTEIARKEAEFDKAKLEEFLATAPKPNKPTGGGNGGTVCVDSQGITWLIPCDYTKVTSPFGMRTHPISGQYKMHNGVDLWCSGIYGKPIYATRDGYVTYSGWYGSGGNTIMIQHDDTYSSVYMHMSWYTVGKGDYVVAGQIIGYVGDSGGTNGAHLHFEIRKDGVPENPMEHIG